METKKVFSRWYGFLAIHGASYALIEVPSPNNVDTHVRPEIYKQFSVYIELALLEIDFVMGKILRMVIPLQHVRLSRQPEKIQTVNRPVPIEGLTSFGFNQYAGMIVDYLTHDPQTLVMIVHKTVSAQMLNALNCEHMTIHAVRLQPVSAEKPANLDTYLDTICSLNWPHKPVYGYEKVSFSYDMAVGSAGFAKFEIAEAYERLAETGVDMHVRSMGAVLYNELMELMAGPGTQTENTAKALRDMLRQVRLLVHNYERIKQGKEPQLIQCTN